MRLEIVKILPRRPTLPATIPQVGQPPRVAGRAGFPETRPTLAAALRQATLPAASRGFFRDLRVFLAGRRPYANSRSNSLRLRTRQSSMETPKK